MNLAYRLNELDGLTRAFVLVCRRRGKGFLAHLTFSVYLLFHSFGEASSGITSAQQTHCLAKSEQHEPEQYSAMLHSRFTYLESYLCCCSTELSFHMFEAGGTQCVSLRHGRSCLLLLRRTTGKEQRHSSQSFWMRGRLWSKSL